MKNLLTKRKKGFTLTELAVVIAVIAILIAVLVPTFTSILTSARQTADLEECKNAYTQLLTQSDYVGNPDKVANAVFVGSNDYCYTVDENGSFDSETCYKVVVLNKNGSSSSLKELNNAICIKAGDTMYIITGQSQPNMDCHEIISFENSYALIYNVYGDEDDETETNMLSLFSETYVVFANRLVCYIDSDYSITGYSISSGVTSFDTNSTYSVTPNTTNDGTCSIESVTTNGLNCISLDETAVEKVTGISGVTLTILAESTKIFAITSALTSS